MVIIENVKYDGMTGNCNEWHSIRFDYQRKSYFAFITKIDGDIIFDHFAEVGGGYPKDLFDDDEEHYLIQDVFTPILKDKPNNPTSDEYFEQHK